jgi:hypothetical protein
MTFSECRDLLKWARERQEGQTMAEYAVVPGVITSPSSACSPPSPAAFQAPSAPSPVVSRSPRSQERAVRFELPAQRFQATKPCNHSAAIARSSARRRHAERFDKWTSTA